MVSQHTHYRSYLRSVLADRKQKNPAYSMRAFAKQLGITQSAVSQILAGKKNLSSATAHEIAARLGLPETDAEIFTLLVQMNAAKSPTLKESVLRKLNQLKPGAPVQELSLDFFRVISDWYHLALRNMVEIDGVDMSPRAAAKRLGISAIEVEAALERLLRLELLEQVPGKAHTYRRTSGYSVARSATPNEALRNFHRQMLSKAQESLVTQTPKEKIIGSETFAFADKYLKEADRITEEYFRKMASLAKKPGRKNQVYHLGVQFFNLTKETQ